MRIKNKKTSSTELVLKYDINPLSRVYGGLCHAVVTLQRDEGGVNQALLCRSLGVTKTLRKLSWL